MGEIFVRPEAATPLPFTGERLTSELTGETEIEHLHRYLLAREFCRGKDVLDVASGEGYGAALIAQVAKSVTGIELAEQVVQHARSSYKAPNLSYQQGDARSLPLAAGSFDIVVSFETLEHFAEQGRFLREVRRVLRDDGILIISTPDRDNYSPAGTAANPFHVSELTEREFDDLLRDQFKRIGYLLQRPLIGSVIMSSAGSGDGVGFCFERRGREHLEASRGLARPRYLLAVASNGEIGPLFTSVFIETSVLGDLGQAATVEIGALRRDVELERDARTHLTRELEDARVHIASIDVERAELKERLGRCHRTAEVMARQQESLAACLTQQKLEVDSLKAEIQRKASLLDVITGEKMQAEEAARQDQSARKQFELDIANLLSSTSWRVTAPLRALKGLLSSAAPGRGATRRADRHAARGSDAERPLPCPGVASDLGTKSAAGHDASANLPAPGPALSVTKLSPISVVIPTYNRADVLADTLRSCVTHAGAVELEFIVIDDGSKDETAEALKRLEHEIGNLIWRTTPNRGPGQARNLGASLAKHPVVMFIGDDIRPCDDRFFEVHARLHSVDGSDTIAVLGKVVWPGDSTDVGFVMSHIQGKGGEQFGYAHIEPHTFLDWRFFYTANISVKRTLVDDWLTGGFLPRFANAAFEDGEFAYRMQNRAKPLRIYYDPSSVGEHIHPYTVETFINRQAVCGMMTKVFIDLHPEVADKLAVQSLVQALGAPAASHQNHTADYMSVVEGVKAWARILDKKGTIGREWWHDELLSAVFELSFLNGFLVMSAESSSNISAGYEYMLSRLLSQLRMVIHREVTGSAFLKGRLGLANEMA